MSEGFADLYRAFEDRFRGRPETVAARLDQYRPLLAMLPAQARAGRRAIDLGCGRGEWLRVLVQEGFDPIGIDLDTGMLEAARQPGIEVHEGDALAFLEGETDASAAVISAFHVVEHLAVDYTLDLLRQAHRVLADGGLLILETPNPENLSVGAHTFHLDPTHRRPLPPPLLAFIAESCGFADIAILRTNGPQPHADAGALETALSSLWEASPDYACLAQKRDAPGEDLPRIIGPFSAGRSQANPADLVSVMDGVRAADRQIASAAALAEEASELAGQAAQSNAEIDSGRERAMQAMDALISDMEREQVSARNAIDARIREVGAAIASVRERTAAAIAGMRDDIGDRIDSLARRQDEAAANASLERRKVRALIEAGQTRSVAERERLEAAIARAAVQADEASRLALAELAALRAEVAAARTSAATDAAIGTALEAERQTARALALELAALQRSTSWRITAPLRSAGTSLRKVLGSTRAAVHGSVLALVAWFDRNPRAKAFALPLLRLVPPLDRRVRTLSGPHRVARSTLPDWARRWHLEPDDQSVSDWERLMRRAEAKEMR